MTQPEQKRPQNCGTSICSCIECVMEPDYKALWEQMCERCDELDKKLAQLEQRNVSEQQETLAWKPDRSGKYLTVVYRDVIPGDEVGAIVDHPKCVIMSWSNAVHDVEQLKNTTPPQRKPLTPDEMWELWNSQGDDAMEQTAAIAFARAIEAAHGIKGEA